ncbi:hypothetical protein MO867_12450 [Microbulbifer sp. OS29]|uniref:Uncharacterized protein n=1 Tax=Microbulbifer okhotskensis TaxID=2926617 RepID=A0A9X2J519_9GAMM|nr:hypothetical protein [Microbulbifer okhotskensis]MCO1335142.1 hypothetical protein [Microbulbifer okhotskensis]
MSKMYQKAVIVLFIALTAFTASCVQLAPKYDAELYSDLTNVNTELMELFSSVARGTHKDSYPERSNQYHALIGKIEALAMQSRTRPVPESDALKKINQYLDSTSQDITFDQQAPSVASLQKIAESLNRMRTEDEDQGLNALAVSLFKNEVVISMDQALTYESFLNR